MIKKDLNAVVAANIKAHMIARGLSQAALAKLASLSQKTISNLLSDQNGEARPKSATLESVDKVAWAMKIEPWRLLMDFTPEERIAWDMVEGAFKALQSGGGKPTLALTNHKANGTNNS